MKKSFLILSLFLCISCLEQDVSESPVKELAYLSFDGTGDMISYAKSVISGVRPDGNEDFKSMEDLYQEALKKLDAAETESDHNAVLSEFHDVIEVQDDEILPAMSDALYRLICNRNGIYEAGGILHRVFDEIIIEATDQSRGELAKLTSTDDINQERFNIMPYAGAEISDKSGRIQYDCNAMEMYAEVTHNEAGCQDDRKAYAHMKASFVVAGNNYQPTFYIDVYGTRRQQTWCNWRAYSTTLESKFASVLVRYSVSPSSPQTFSSIFDDYIGTIDEQKHIIFFDTAGEFVTWDHASPITVKYLSAHQEASSRGTPNAWAILHCQQ